MFFPFGLNQKKEPKKSSRADAPRLKKLRLALIAKIAIKRTESQACLSYPERKQFIQKTRYASSAQTYAVLNALNLLFINASPHRLINHAECNG